MVHGWGTVLPSQNRARDDGPHLEGEEVKHQIPPLADLLVGEQKRGLGADVLFDIPSDELEQVVRIHATKELVHLEAD